MGSIPLPALGVKPVEQPDVLGNFARIMQLKQQMQEAPVRQQLMQQQVEGQGIQNQQARQAQKDDQAWRGAMAQMPQNGMTLGQMADQLAKHGQISMGAWQAAKQKDREAQQQLSTANANDFKLHSEIQAQIQNLYNNAMNLPDDQLAAQTAQIVQQYDQLVSRDPVMKNAPQLNPGQPLTKQMLSQFGPMISMGNAYRDQELARRKNEAQTAASEATAKVAGTPKTVTTAEGVFTLNPDGTKGNRLGSPVKATNMFGSAGAADIKETASLITEHNGSPVLTDYSFRDRTALAAELHRRGFNQAAAAQEWKATQRYLSSVNGPQQLRLRQAIGQIPELTDKIDQLYNEFHQLAPTAGMKVFNKASIAAAKQFPGRAGAVAQALDAQISDLVSDLGNVYMGGNSPTDHALSLAQKNLSADWNEATFKEAINQIRRNVQIRSNYLDVGPAGAGAENYYQAPTPENNPQPSAPTIRKYNPATGKLE